MNSIPSSERIMQELINLNRNPSPNMGMVVGLIEENNLYRWKANFLGPKQTPYEKGLFYLEIIVPKLYPEQAPKIIFKTPIYHPNVNMRKSSINFPLGQVAHKAINYWKPSYSIKEVLTKLYSIFFYPNLDLAYSLEIAKEYKENRNLFNKKAKYFTKKYASVFSIRWKEYEYWDFSCNENYLNSMEIKPKENKINHKDYDGNQLITLNFDINGIVETKINCKLNELMQDIIKKVLNQNGIQKKNDILIIFNSQRIELNIPIGEYNLCNMCKINIILNE